MCVHIQILRPCAFTQILRTGTLHVQSAVPCGILEAFAATAAPNGHGAWPGGSPPHSSPFVATQGARASPGI